MGLICRPMPSVLLYEWGSFEENEFKKLTKYPPSSSSHPKPGRASNSFACLLKCTKSAQSEDKKLSGRGGIAGCSERCFRQRMAQNKHWNLWETSCKPPIEHISNSCYFLFIIIDPILFFSHFYRYIAGRNERWEFDKIAKVIIKWQIEWHVSLRLVRPMQLLYTVRKTSSSWIQGTRKSMNGVSVYILPMGPQERCIHLWWHQQNYKLDSKLHFPK